MTHSRTLAAALIVAAVAAAAAVATSRGAPDPSADVARGSEGVFAAPLQLREIPPGGTPLRWTGASTTLRFLDVPAGPATLDVVVRGHRSAVQVSADGALLGTVEPGATEASFALPPGRRGERAVELRVEPFRAGDGRALGTMLQRVALHPAPAGRPSARTLALFALPALVALAAALLCGLGLEIAAGTGLLVPLLMALLLWPLGLLHSGYAPALAASMAGGVALAALFARACARRVDGAGPWAFAAALAAFVVQGLIAASPVMVVSDAVFHANNLLRVAAGDPWITSVTQHAKPFRFPYGVSFYVLLAPFARAGLDPVGLVRMGAALSAVAASLALFAALLRRSTPARAGLAVVLLVLLPITLDVHSHGNLSNVFGQALTTAFFAWWLGGAPGGWPLGAVLFAVGATAHFSSLVVLGVLSVMLVALARRDTGRTRALAAGLGMALAAAYYVHFVPLVLRQLPRLLEGGGQGRGVSHGPLGVLHLQLLGMAGGWGLAALALAVPGWPRGAEALARDARAYWLAGGVLAALALVSPLDVRYLYALSIPLALAAADGACALLARGTFGRVAALALLAAQAAQAAANALDAVLRRYR